MADRSFSNTWDVNLDRVLKPANSSRYMSFVLNCHDWVNPALSAQTVNFFLDTLEQQGGKGEIYITSPLLRAWEASSPDLVNRLRAGSHTVSYHVRPPHPLTFGPTKDKLQAHPLADYETYHLVLETGDLDTSKLGGSLSVSQTFGRAPVATGINALSRELRNQFAGLMASKGTRVGVFDHGPVATLTGYENLLTPSFGIYPRPNDYFLERVDLDGHPDAGGNFWWNRVAEATLTPQQLAAAFRQDFLEARPTKVGQSIFGVCVIHENDFYVSGTPWGPVYFNDPQMNSPKAPPYDLSAKAAWVKDRTEAEQVQIREAFAALVAEAAKAPGTRIVTSLEISHLADQSFSPQSEPQKTAQWVKDPGLEETPAEAYAWQEAPSFGGPFGGSFSISTEAPQSGTYRALDPGRPGCLLRGGKACGCG